MKELKKYLFNLRMFDGEDGEEPNTGKDNDDENAVGKDNADGGGKKPDKPFAVFPDEESFMSRVQREAKKINKDFLKSLGVEKESDLKSLLKQKKEEEEAKKSDLEKAKEEAEQAKKNGSDAIERANKVLLTADARVTAAELGIDSKKIAYALKLADFSDVKVEDGEVDNKAVKAALKAVIADLPELVSKPGSSKGGEDFDEKDKSTEGLTVEALKNMSTAEAEKRMPEIMEFLNKNKK
jgi:hypothetical protein